MRRFGPSPEQIAEHDAEKAQWLAVKMGLIHLCSNCHEEIFLHIRSDVVWVHMDNRYEFGRWPCYNDVSDGIAWPMSDSDIQDLHDQITKDDWWYEEND